MLDNQETEPSEEVDAVAVMYDSEPLEPTEIVEEAEETETEVEEAEEEADSTTLEADDTEEEAEVFDKPNDFAKFEYDEESELYSFRSDGKKVQVSLPNLIGNFQFNQNLARKSEQLASERKGVFDEAKSKEIASLQEQAKKFDELSKELESVLAEKEEAVDWDELRDIDPSEYLRQKEIHEKRLKVKKDSEDVLKAEKETRRESTLNSEAFKLKERMNWVDDEAANQDIELARKYVEDLGVSQEEVSELLDHRFWAGMIDAAKYQDLLKKSEKQKEVKKPPKSIKSRKVGASEERTPEQIFYD